MTRLLHLLTLTLVFGFASGIAQAQSSDAPSTRDIAQRSLGGPIAETTAGVTLLTVTPLVGAFVAFVAGPGITLGCEDWTTGEVDEDCELAEQEERAHGARVAIGVAVPLGLVGAALLTHGAYRIRRIKQARRMVALSLTGLELQRRGASVAFRLTF